MNFSRTLIILFSFLPFHTVADIVWPEYSQQCRDDAGPLYVDDEEQFGPNGFYHDNHAVFPVLNNGNCAKPLQEACNQRPTYKAAYLEGPIDCGNNGWYCRIMPDPNWPAENLIADLNFGHCNTTEAFEDAGYDRDGHCHGSDVDSTYYWWIRDHFHRGYNGRLRCCCGWYEDTSETPMYKRRIANRCDYRRLVTESEDLNNCRDANEDHGLGFDDIGCDPNYESSQLNEPIPENDDICWEIQKFGYAEQGNNDNGEEEEEDEDDVDKEEEDEEEEEEDEEEEEEDEDDGDDEEEDEDNGEEEEEEEDENEGDDEEEEEDEDDEEEDQEDSYYVHENVQESSAITFFSTTTTIRGGEKNLFVLATFTIFFLVLQQKLL